jgi:hypothetical protein
MLAASGASAKLEQLEDARRRGERYVIYGDPAYGVTRSILAPFLLPGNLLTINE